MQIVSTIDEKKTKDLLKAALVELMEENPDAFSQAVIQAMQEVGLARAIREGRQDDFIDEKEVFSILEN
ncbi:MAG: hypothetical protein GXP37_03185 [Chloroflexi bacterium]|nr:hypothetical protein [Chloroflexota bacterium]